MNMDEECAIDLIKAVYDLNNSIKKQNEILEEIKGELTLIRGNM